MIGAIAAVETGVVAVRDGAAGVLGLAVPVITADTRWAMGGLLKPASPMSHGHRRLFGTLQACTTHAPAKPILTDNSCVISSPHVLNCLCFICGIDYWV